MGSEQGAKHLARDGRFIPNSGTAFQKGRKKHSMCIEWGGPAGQRGRIDDYNGVAFGIPAERRLTAHHSSAHQAQHSDHAFCFAFLSFGV